jgi:hypothetical protein
LVEVPDRLNHHHHHVCTLQAEVPGVHGRVSELVRVTNRKYNLAMAVVMQRDLDSVVVDNRAAGFACVDFLKANKWVALQLKHACCVVFCLWQQHRLLSRVCDVA